MTDGPDAGQPGGPGGVSPPHGGGRPSGTTAGRLTASPTHFVHAPSSERNNATGKSANASAASKLAAPASAAGGSNCPGERVAKAAVRVQSRDRHLRAPPDVRPQGHVCGRRGQAGEAAWDDHHGPPPAEPAGEAEQVLGTRASGCDGKVFTGGEQPGELTPGEQGLPGDVKFNPPVFLIPGEVASQARRSSTGRAGLRGQIGQHSPAHGVVHRPAVVGIDQAEVPQFRPLVGVGHARRGEPQQRLRQGVEQAPVADPPLERRGSRRGTAPAVCSSRTRPTNCCDRARRSSAFGVDPARVDLGLVQRLLHVLPGCARRTPAYSSARVRLQRPGAEERLVEQVFLVARRAPAGRRPCWRCGSLSSPQRVDALAATRRASRTAR